MTGRRSCHEDPKCVDRRRCGDRYRRCVEDRCSRSRCTKHEAYIDLYDWTNIYIFVSIRTMKIVDHPSESAYGSSEPGTARQIRCTYDSSPERFETTFAPKSGKEVVRSAG